MRFFLTNNKKQYILLKYGKKVSFFAVYFNQILKNSLTFLSDRSILLHNTWQKEELYWSKQGHTLNISTVLLCCFRTAECGCTTWFVRADSSWLAVRAMTMTVPNGETGRSYSGNTPFPVAELLSTATIRSLWKKTMLFCCSFLKSTATICLKHLTTGSSFTSLFAIPFS